MKRPPSKKGSGRSSGPRSPHGPTPPHPKRSRRPSAPRSSRGRVEGEGGPPTLPSPRPVVSNETPYELPASRQAPELRVLATLSEAGEPMSINTLVARVGLDARAVYDALEGLGSGFVWTEVRAGKAYFARAGRAERRSGPAPSLPKWIDASSLSNATTPELLLYAIAGERGGVSSDRPLAAIAHRISHELGALQASLPALVDDRDVVDAVHHLAQRVSVLAELLERGEL